MEDRGRRRKASRILVSCALLGFVLVYLGAAWQLHEESRRAPLVVGVPTAVLAAVNVVREVRQTSESSGPAALKFAPRAALAPEPDDADGVRGDRAHAERAAPTDAAQGSERASPSRAYLWLLGFTAAYAVLGQTVGMFLVTLLFVRFEGRRSWLLCAMFAAGVSLAVFLFFTQFLGVRYYRGLLDLPF